MFYLRSLKQIIINAQTVCYNLNNVIIGSKKLKKLVLPIQFTDNFRSINLIQVISKHFSNLKTFSFGDEFSFIIQRNLLNSITYKSIHKYFFDDQFIVSSNHSKFKLNKVLFKFKKFTNRYQL